MSRHQLRAARALLLLRQEVLANLARVGVATLRRFENGTDVDPELVEALRLTVEAEGAVLIYEGSRFAGSKLGLGVALKPENEILASTKAMLDAVDATPDQAVVRLPTERVGKVGCRTRVPYASK